MLILHVLLFRLDLGNTILDLNVLLEQSLGTVTFFHDLNIPVKDLLLFLELIESLVQLLIFSSQVWKLLYLICVLLTEQDDQSALKTHLHCSLAHSEYTLANSC